MTLRDELAAASFTDDERVWINETSAHMNQSIYDALEPFARSELPVSPLAQRVAITSTILTLFGAFILDELERAGESPSDTVTALSEMLEDWVICMQAKMPFTA